MSSPTRPATHLDKSDVLEGLFASWDAIDRLVSDLPDDRWMSPTPLPGWCVHDVVAHVIGTESMLHGVATPESDVDVSTLEHVRNDIGVMNECWVRTLRGVSARRRARAVPRRRRPSAARLTGDDRPGVEPITATPAGPDTYGRFMRVRIFDCWMHEHDIRDALRAAAVDADSDGPASRLALDEMAASMGFVVGKLGKAPGRIAGGHRTDRADAADHQGRRRGRAPVVEDFGEPSRRRRSGSTACCSPGWRAAGDACAAPTRSRATAATRRSASGSSSTSTT